MSREVWNEVDLHGPQGEIDRLKALCLVPGAVPNEYVGIDFARIPSPTDYPIRGSGSAWAICGRENVEAWNFREWRSDVRGSYQFAFDTAGRFPMAILERLAVLFPALAFDCWCIADDDAWMGLGWFNVPPGGERFRDDLPVPDDYWEGGARRGADAEDRHRRLKTTLTLLAAAMD